MIVTGFLGSPRKAGNTNTLLQVLLNGAAGQGAVTETVFLHDLNIQACQGCYRCEATGKCALVDGMAPLYEKVRVSDAVVLATPIYFHYVTAQTKLFLDRLYCFIDVVNQRQSRLTRQRPGAIVLTYEHPDPNRYLHVARDQEAIMNRFNFQVIETIVQPGLGKNAAPTIPADALKRAFDCGARLGAEGR